MSGVAIASAIEGVRPFLIETQALVSSAAYGVPQRSATGFDLRRMAGLPMTVKLTDASMPVYGNYNTPSLGAALFHQSTYNDFLIKGLSATVGLRLDYEKLKITHSTNATMIHRFDTTLQILCRSQQFYFSWLHHLISSILNGVS